MTKADKIREMKRENPSITSTAIADELDTSPGYVREVWQDDAGGDVEASDDTTPDDAGDELGDDASGGDLSGLGEEPADPGGADVEPDGPLGDLIISDEWDEYECSECEAEVEYLQETCGECGETLAWWAE